MDADEVSITDTALRRIRPLHVVKDPKAPGGQRASSAAFDDDPDGSSMSVYMQSIVFKGSLTLGDVVYGKPSRWAVAATPVEKLIAEDQRIELDRYVIRQHLTRATRLMRWCMAIKAKRNAENALRQGHLLSTSWISSSELSHWPTCRVLLLLVERWIGTCLPAVFQLHCGIDEWNHALSGPIPADFG